MQGVRAAGGVAKSTHPRASAARARIRLVVGVKGRVLTWPHDRAQVILKKGAQVAFFQEREHSETAEVVLHSQIGPFRSKLQR